MRYNGCTVIPYQPVYHDLLAELKRRGYDTFRFINHDQTCYYDYEYTPGLPKWTPWISIAADMCRLHGTRLLSTLSSKSVPIDLRDSRGHPNDWAKYEKWLSWLMEKMILETGQKLLYFEVGNEFEASSSNWTLEEHKQLYDTALAARERLYSTHRNLTVRIGGPAHVVTNDMQRFEAMVEHIAPTCDFVSFHLYNDIAAVKEYSNIIKTHTQKPIWITESGPDYQANPLYNDPKEIERWKAEFFAHCAAYGIQKVFLMHCWRDLSLPVENQPPSFICELWNQYII